MVEIQFVDGSSEIIETYEKSEYEYDGNFKMFVLTDMNGYYVMFPREFVKSIRRIEV